MAYSMDTVIKYIPNQWIVFFVRSDWLLELRIVYSYSLKWKRIARRGKCLPVFTDTEVNNCFSTFQTKG